MGMDVIGRKPTSEIGRHYQRGGRIWCALADFMLAKIDRRIMKQCRHWQSNDGDGLKGDDALKLAEALARMLDDGTVAAYIWEHAAALDALPDEVCEFCGGTGVRRDEGGVEAGMPEKVIDEKALDVGPFCNDPSQHPRFGQAGFCNGCWGVGHQRPFECADRFEEEDARALVAFLRDCGGFNIL